jgi:hypothetical protein
MASLRYVTGHPPTPSLWVIWKRSKPIHKEPKLGISYINSLLCQSRNFQPEVLDMDYLHMINMKTLGRILSMPWASFLTIP